MFPRAVSGMKLRRLSVWVLFALMGSAFMVLGIHPLIEAIHFLRMSSSGGGKEWLEAMARAYQTVLRPDMALLNAIGGATVGAGLAALYLSVGSRQVPKGRTDWDQDSLQALIARGESETLEFKSSLRWDWKQDRPNKALEGVVAKSICGLMNHRGGTLHDANWDGFERCLISLVEGRLGGRHCLHVHSHRIETAGKTIALVEVESASDQVFCRDGNIDRFYVRTGNSTRELDVKEALAHISQIEK